jgi:hypothetical protein
MGYSCWGTENDAWENASESDWIEADFDVHYCPGCYSYDDNDNLIVKELAEIRGEEKKEEARSFIVCDCDQPEIEDNNLCKRCGGYNRNGF